MTDYLNLLHGWQGDRPSPTKSASALCDTLSHRHFRDRCTPRAGSAGGCHSHGPACRASRHLHRRRRSVSEACTLICKKCCCHLDFRRLLRPEIKSGHRKMGKPGCVAFPPTRIAFAQRVRDAGAHPRGARWLRRPAACYDYGDKQRLWFGWWDLHFKMMNSCWPWTGNVYGLYAMLIQPGQVPSLHSGPLECHHDKPSDSLCARVSPTAPAPALLLYQHRHSLLPHHNRRCYRR